MIDLKPITHIFRVTSDIFSSVTNFGKLAVRVLASILYSHFVVPNFSSYYFTTISVEIFETSCQHGRPREHERLLFSAIIVPISLSSHFFLALAQVSGNTWHRRFLQLCNNISAAVLVVLF